MQKSPRVLYKEFYFIENDILYRSIMDNGHKFSAAVVPEDLTCTVLVLGHNQSGHMVTRGFMLQLKGVTIGRE